MAKQAVASWLAKHSNAPTTVLKPVATRLGVPTNYLGAALFAGQLVYENQDAIVTYASRGGVTVGEFLHARARDRYGEDHPLTRHLGENVEAVSEAFEGTEAEARTFAAFYREYRTVDREHRLRDELDRDAVAAVADRLPGRDAIPDRDSIPGTDRLPNVGGLVGTDAIPGGRRLADGDAGATTDDTGTDDVRADDDGTDDAVEIPVTDAK